MSKRNQKYKKVLGKLQEIVNSLRVTHDNREAEKLLQKAHGLLESIIPVELHVLLIKKPIFGSEGPIVSALSKALQEAPTAKKLAPPSKLPNPISVPKKKFFENIENPLADKISQRNTAITPAKDPSMLATRR